MATSIIQCLNVSSSNYCKFPDGTLIQWGTVELDGGKYNYIFTNYLPYIDDKFSVVASSQSQNINVGAASYGNRGIQVSVSPSLSVATVNYITIGRWK